MASTATGQVVSAAGNKTIVVKVDHQRRHPIYGKQYQVSNKIMAHDEDNQASTGDTVEIEETRPISRRKRWTLTRVIEKYVSLKEEA